MSEDLTQAPGPALERVNCHESLVKALAEQFARADVSLRELQARADRAGGARLPRATCADMLAGRRFPKKAVMVAFLRACRVPEPHIPAWERAWERVRLNRLPLTHPPTPQPTGPPAPGADPPATPSGTAPSGTWPSGARTPEAGNSGPEPPRTAASGAGPSTAWPTGTAPSGTGAWPSGTAPSGAGPSGAAPTGAAHPGAASSRPVSLEVGRRAGRRRGVVLVAAGLTVVAGVGVSVALTAGPWGGTPDTLSRRTLVPGHIVSDDGRAFPRGGRSRFTVTVEPRNTGVRLIRRLDVGVALQHASITVNGLPAGEWRPLMGDDVYKWRNQIVELPPELTAGRRKLTVVNTSLSSSGFNEFLYVVEQRLDGAWETADTVDVGESHASSEAAHDYGTVGEDWADTQTFAYPPRPEDWTVE